ncbi:hypothetical protein N7447_010181 [Penicillium robsamsonii]|uniref:uncharacterized protein n=1 Tax=Penicillium robsamsonii TaxID=1792511 RepID=UPI0025475A11|nr:uncharacterized protein N7447_010181 [Penicillium robsamsonii]KAJ5813158.1 hypothetical protein N7447_010181 [Penicillium robsamsonii]
MAGYGNMATGGRISWVCMRYQTLIGISGNRHVRILETRDRNYGRSGWEVCKSIGLKVRGYGQGIVDTMDTMEVMRLESSGLEGVDAEFAVELHSREDEGKHRLMLEAGPKDPDETRNACCSSRVNKIASENEKIMISKYSKQNS